MMFRIGKDNQITLNGKPVEIDPKIGYYRVKVKQDNTYMLVMQNGVIKKIFKKLAIWGKKDEKEKIEI